MQHLRCTPFTALVRNGLDSALSGNGYVARLLSYVDSYDGHCGSTPGLFEFWPPSDRFPVAHYVNSQNDCLAYGQHKSSKLRSLYAAL